MNIVLQTSTVIAIAHIAIMLAIAIRVIMRRPARGVALAWLLLVSVFPIGGAVVYLLVGERRISPRRSRELDTPLRLDYRKVANTEIPIRLTEIDWAHHSLAARGINRIGRDLVGSPTVHGSRMALLSDTQEMLKAIARIDAAQTSIMMEFYIWNAGGAADDVLDALIRAASACSPVS